MFDKEFTITLEQLERGVENWKYLAPHKGRLSRGSHTLTGFEYRISKLLNLIGSALLYQYDLLLQKTDENKKANLRYLNKNLERLEKFKKLDIQNMELIDLVDFDLKNFVGL
ncbi:MAG: hypothetical protein ACRDDH_20385 [Cetobacterium sp.]|uniref:hypothetical protein n=1 Tax=Cetobacterium sp. TaxID=2071632 RepID=UPI003EE81521